MYIPEHVMFALDRLERSGFSAYLVGGCVRDFIMNVPPHDFDITTSAAPDMIEECFSDIKTLDIGKKHGTITLVFDKENVEVTTYRIDGEYKDSRHPESVTFTDKIEEDLSRRDFTMNAIAYSPTRGFVDPFDGMTDINNAVVRCVGEPEKRFEEDALRIMRALRFSSRLGFKIEDNTKKAIHDKKYLLENIAKERINSEFCGILQGKYSGYIISAFYDIFKLIIPEINSIDYDSIDRAGNYDLTVKLILFFSHFENVRELTDIMKRMKFDNATVRTVTQVVSLFNEYIPKYGKADIKRAVSKIGFDNTVLLYWSLFCHRNAEICLTAIDTLNEMALKGECMSVRQLDIKGNEIIDKYGISPSLVGDILQKLLDDVIDGKCKNKKGSLLRRAGKYF